MVTPYQTRTFESNMTSKSTETKQRFNHAKMIAGNTHKTANFLGLRINTPVGIKAKQMMNINAAATLRPPKTSSRSHLLTAVRVSLVDVQN
jgi:hypothetical protein